MRVFYLTTEFLWPAHQGGRVRSLASLRLLAAQPEVQQLTIFSLTEVAVGDADRAALRAAIAQPLPTAPPRHSDLELDLLPPLSHPIHLKQAPLSLLRVALERAQTGVPYLATKWSSAAVRAALFDALATARPDVVYIDHLGMALYLPAVRQACPAARVVLEEHNVESDFFAQFAERAPLPLRPLAVLEHAAAERFEAQTLTAVDAVVAISQLDAEALAALARLRTGRRITPHVVPQLALSAEPQRRPPPAPRLCYVGNLTWHPNARGLSWFCQAVWPKVRAALPTVQLSIAGSGLPVDEGGRPRAPREWQQPGIEILGYVPQLEALYDRSLGMIAPILGGSGVRIKLLEAFAAGMPVVTTTAGAAGLPVRHDGELLIADEPADFAAAVVRLSQDPALQERLRAAGYAFLRAHHSPQRARAVMREVLGLPPS
jgi:glycosyltransferase involved in cell wall biosynthesis